MEGKQLTVMNVMPKVLVVEDDWVIRGLIHDILETEGFQVTSVETGDDAWSWLAESSAGADLSYRTFTCLAD
jgi:CheY-like chemotaxis protein